ncbi:glycosyltransferase family 4 protein [uncultured Albimonas sp.]|uniref:glycosyltransferase family 4 protein n=1 Tax=uncultured Albimonas sp. TaxID=1331701 RepID=UPI0030EF758A
MLLGLTSPAWPGADTPNGIVTAVANLRAGLEATGHGAVVISGRREPGSDAVPLPPHPPERLLKRLLRRLEPAEAFFARDGVRLARLGEELVRARGVRGFLMEETYGWAGVAQAGLSVPVITVLHGPWDIHQGLSGLAPTEADRQRIRLEAEGLRRSGGVAAPSRDVLDRMIARAEVPDETPRAMIPNAIVAGPRIDFDSLDARERRSLLFVGRFDRHKGGDVALEAFARLIAGGADAWLTFVGPDRGVETPGLGRRSLAEALAALPAETRARIDVRGQLAREEVARLRLRHALTVVPSRYETFGYTVLEAMAAGSPLVASRVGAIPSIVDDGRSGVLTPPGDAAALAAACQTLLDDPARMRRIGEAARQEALRVYAPETVARQTVAFVEECAEALARRRRG